MDTKLINQELNAANQYERLASTGAGENQVIAAIHTGGIPLFREQIFVPGTLLPAPPVARADAF